MDKLPHELLLHILSLLDDSADVACCRVASKDFNTVFPDLRSINLQCWYNEHVYPKKERSRSMVSCSSSSQSKKSFRDVFFDLTSELNSVESVRISFNPTTLFGSLGSGCYFLDKDFAVKWLPRVSVSLKSLSISCLGYSHSSHESNVLRLISEYCHNLVKLKLSFECLSIDDMNPMPSLTTLTLESIYFQDEHLTYELNKCFPNLQVLKLVDVTGFKNLTIHLLNLQTFHLTVKSIDCRPSLTLITPKLVTLKIDQGFIPVAFQVEAPILSHFNLNINTLQFDGPSKESTGFKDWNTLWLHCTYTCSLLSELPITKTDETLTLDSGDEALRILTDSRLILRKVFTVFPSVSCLCINSGAWLEFESCLDQEGWEILIEKKGLKRIRAYLTLVDPTLTFSSIGYMLDRCIGLVEVSLLIHGDVGGIVFEGFMSKCMARLPRLKLRWGIWSEHSKDSWITD